MNAPLHGASSPDARVSVVTGATSGIGLATAQALLDDGGYVVIVGHSDAHGEEALATLANEHRERAMFAKADVADVQQVQDAVSTTIKRWGRIDLLVNNAAMMVFASVVDLAPADWDRVLAVNLKSAFLFSKFAIPHMPRGSAIVNVSSVHAHETTAQVSAYAASKGGLEAFSRGLSRELLERDIRVNVVAPGAVDTEMLRSNPNVESGEEKIDGPVGQPADIAAAILFLASQRASFVNGTTLVVDGGRLDAL